MFRSTSRAGKSLLQAQCSHSTPSTLRRHAFSFARTQPSSSDPKEKSNSQKPKSKPILAQDDLFHVLARSPIPAMREKAARIKKLAYCPVSLAKYNELKHVDYDCEACGWPTHASRERWEEDEQKERYWEALRQVNEDEHDLRSGREITEFNMPGEQAYDEAVNLSDWDTFLYTRGFPSIDSDRPRRHLSKVLTYPMTIASVLHEFSPYTTSSGRLTPEGMRSLAALRQTLHPPLGFRPTLDPSSATYARPLAPLRIVMVGARAESSLPPHVYHQLNHLFPKVPLHLFFVGPEVFLPPSASPASVSPYGVPTFTNIVSPELTLTSLRCSYDEIHSALEPFDPYYDVFCLYSPGFGFPTTYDSSLPSGPYPESASLAAAQPAVQDLQIHTVWKDTLPTLLQTKCPLIITAFSPADLERDLGALQQADLEGISGEWDWIINPGVNEFGSDKWEVAEFDLRVHVKTNWFVYAIRGKLYEIEESEWEEEEEIEEEEEEEEIKAELDEPAKKLEGPRKQLEGPKTSPAAAAKDGKTRAR